MKDTTMIAKLKRIVRLKTCIQVLFSVFMLALFYYISNCIKDNNIGGLSHNARHDKWMYGGGIHRGEPVSIASELARDGEISSDAESSDSESELEWQDSADHDDAPVTDEGKMKDVLEGESSGGDNRRTVFVPSRGEPVVIIILAQWRFGSSVIGELFNQNPGIFFLYEPLWVVEEMVRLWRLPGPFAPETYYYSTKLMRDFAQCNFSDEFMGMVNLTNHWGGKFRNRVVCERTDAKCNIPDAEWLHNVCQEFKGHLAAKLIRGDLNTIKPLIVEDNANVKVIHLFRDPRGSAASRINYMYQIAKVEEAHPKYAEAGRLEPLQLFDFEQKHSDSITGMCQWVRETAFHFEQIPEWLKDRYYRLRYEDFADDPSRTTEDLYKFAGLELPGNVREWVVKNTHAKRSAEGTFDVKKNSSLTAKHWIQDLSPVEIQQVEDKCSDVMKILGYELYDTLPH